MLYLHQRHRSYCVQVRINHWENRANARSLAFFRASHLNIKTLLYCFFHVFRLLTNRQNCILLSLRLVYRLRKLTTLAFMVFEWLTRIEPNSTTLYDPKNSVHQLASAEIFPDGATSTFCLSFLGQTDRQTILVYFAWPTKRPGGHQSQLTMGQSLYAYSAVTAAIRKGRCNANGLSKTLYPFYPISLCWLNLNSQSIVWNVFYASVIINAFSFHKLPNIHFFRALSTIKS